MTELEFYDVHHTQRLTHAHIDMSMHRDITLTQRKGSDVNWVARWNVLVRKDATQAVLFSMFLWSMSNDIVLDGIVFYAATFNRACNHSADVQWQLAIFWSTDVLPFAPSRWDWLRRSAWFPLWQTLIFPWQFSWCVLHLSCNARACKWRTGCEPFSGFL